MPRVWHRTQKQGTILLETVPVGKNKYMVRGLRVSDGNFFFWCLPWMIIIDKELDMSDWNLLWQRRITADQNNNFLFVYIFSVWKNKITMKLGALSVNDENIINKISCDLGKVTKCALYLRRLFCSCLHMVEVISPGHIYSLWMVQTDTYVSFWLLNFCFPMFLIHYLNPRIRDLL